MSYTYLHYDNVLIIELREEKHLKQIELPGNQND